MLEGLERITYQTGDPIFHEGETGNNAYLIEKGSVEISIRHGNSFLRICVLGVGELIGEMALIDQDTRTATATALEETCLVSISRDMIEEMFSRTDPIIKQLLSMVVNRFRERHRLNQYVAQNVGPVPVTLLHAQDVSEDLISHVQFTSEIKEAIKNEEFQLYYQPVTAVKNEQLVGFEALIRWIHPERGLVSPEQFLNVVLETDQILPLGIWILERACRDLGTLTKEYINYYDEDSLSIAVNISARQLANDEHTEQFENIINKAGVKPTSIILEVTENVMIAELAKAQKTLSRFRDMGFRVSLDDFGTGFSSLSHLQRFPVDDIKIDRSFISHMLADKNSMQIVKASVELAKALGLEIVAEGVESKEEMEILSELNCTYIQGYYYAKPLPLDEAIEYIGKSY